MYIKVINKINSIKHRINILKKLQSTCIESNLDYHILSFRISCAFVTLIDLEDLLK